MGPLSPEDRLERLESLVRALSTARTIEEVALAITTAICVAVSAEAATIMTTCSGSEALVAVGTSGAQEVDAQPNVERAFREGIATWIGRDAVVPFAIATRPLGVAWLSFASTELLATADRAFVDTLLALAAHALDRARKNETEHDARIASERLEILLDANEGVARASEPDAVLARLGRLVVPRLADWCIVDLLDESGAVQLSVSTPTNAPKVALAHLSGVVRTGRAELHADIVDAAGMRSAMIVPLVARDRVLGAMTLVSTRDDRRYDATDLRVAERLASRAALALHNARLIGELRARADAELEARRHVERLQAVTSTLAEIVATEQVATVVLVNALQELQGDFALYYEPSPDGRELVLVAHRNLPAEVETLAKRIPNDGESVISKVVRDGAPVFLESREEYDAIFRSPPPASRAFHSARSFVGMPLALPGGRLHGVIAINFAEPRRFTSVDRAFVTNLAAQCAQALERAYLYAAERRAKRDAETANRLKDEFLATVSHELRTPLNAILGWASLLRAKRLDSEAMERAFATIERNALAQARLVDDVLDVSRIISGKLAIRAAPVDVGTVLSLALDVVRPAALAKDIAIDLTIAPGLRCAAGDSDRLQQIYWNLFSNAVRFTPRGGRVWIDAREEPGAIVVTVSDNGKGIHPDFLPHLFEPFRQADGSSTRAHGGLGLGLSIARHLAQLHGGEIRAESEGEDRGAKFTVSLPATSDEPKAKTTARHRPAARLLGIEILVIDDDADSREIAKAVLSSEGALVRVACSAKQAIERIEEHVPAILVCDVGMPEEDGFSLLPRARVTAKNHGGTFTALAFTAYADAEHTDLARQVGFEAHLAKPVDAQALVAAVARLIQSPSVNGVT